MQTHGALRTLVLSQQKILKNETRVLLFLDLVDICEETKTKQALQLLMDYYNSVLVDIKCGII